MLLYSFVCFLIISRIETNVAKNSNSITEKLPMNGERLLDIQTQLLEIQDDVISITKAIAQADGLNSIVSKIAVTEESFQLIEDEMANGLHQTDECSESAVKLLNNQCDAVRVQLKNLQLSLTEYKQKRLPLDTIADIKGLRFNSAEEKLQQLNSFSDVLKIVQDAYASSSHNFDLLANLTESLTDIDLAYGSVKALQQEISRHGDGDPHKWIRLIKIMEAGVINQPLVKPSTKASAQDVINELNQSIRVFTLNALESHVSKGSFERNGGMDNLTTAVFLLDPSNSESIIEQFVHKSFENKALLKDIFDTILSHRFIQQRISGIMVLFWKIKDSHNTNDDVTINIASALYKIYSDDEFKTLSRSMRIGVKRIIENLPTCARNLYFLPSVCLWNKAKEEYLTAGNSTWSNDKLRRNIFLSEDPLPGSHWYVQRTGENFLFSSRNFPNEFLYAANFNFNQDLRYLFSWIPGNNIDEQSKWNIRLNGDYCYIQSATYSEHMISSNYKPLDDMHLSYVFTWIPRTKMEQHEFQWQIRKCD